MLHFSEGACGEGSGSARKVDLPGRLAMQLCHSAQTSNQSVGSIKTFGVEEPLAMSAQTHSQENLPYIILVQ